MAGWFIASQNQGVDGRKPGLRGCDWVNPHDLRWLAATEVILGLYAEAGETYATLAGSAGESAAQWFRDIAEEARVRSVLLQHDPTVVHEALTATIQQQTAHLGLPPAP
jgi:hypothetical protein